MRARGNSRSSWLFLLTLCGAGVLAGCTTGGTPPEQPFQPSPTVTARVNLVLSSTANDQLTLFAIALAKITLTDKAGNTAVLFTSAPPPQGFLPGQSIEFMHLNGNAEPFLAAAIPQDLYTSATVAVEGCDFSIIGPASNGSWESSTYAEGLCGQGTGMTTVNLAAPINLIGVSTATLSLDLQVSRSYTLTCCDAFGQSTYTVSPVFDLKPIAVATEPSNNYDGKEFDIAGQITSVGTEGSLALLTVDGGALSFQAGSGTTYQGVSGFPALATGMFVNLDAAFQSDGSLLATRIAVEDTSGPRDMFEGPVMGVFNVFNDGSTGVGIYEAPVIAQGADFGALGGPGFGGGYKLTNATFQISGGLTNLQGLPFTPAFDGSHMVGGQAVLLTGNKLLGNYPPASTIMLSPQTINGVVEAISQIGGFNVYTVNLASYDAFPTDAAIEANLKSPQNPYVLSAPSTVIVYADSNTRMLNSMPPQQGATMRFRGLVFDDSGTLRVDCAEIRDGVAE